jgi:hypothetical protein
MSREQFIEAAGRVRRYGITAYFLTCATAGAFAFVLPSWAWLRALLRDQAVGWLVGWVVLAPFLLTPVLALVWADRRFGLRCPGCKRSVILRCRAGEVLRSGRCRCRQVLFEPGDG